MQSKWSHKVKNVFIFTKVATKDLTQSEFSRRVLSIVCEDSEWVTCQKKKMYVRASKEIKIHESYQPYYLVWSWTVIIKGSFTNLPLSYKTKEN